MYIIGSKQLTRQRATREREGAREEQAKGSDTSIPPPSYIPNAKKGTLKISQDTYIYIHTYNKK